MGIFGENRFWSVGLASFSSSIEKINIGQLARWFFLHVLLRENHFIYGIYGSVFTAYQ